MWVVCVYVCNFYRVHKNIGKKEKQNYACIFTMHLTHSLNLASHNFPLMFYKNNKEISSLHLPISRLLAMLLVTCHLSQLHDKII